MAGAFQDAADLARVYLHSAAMGVPEWAQRHIGPMLGQDPTIADRTDAAVAQSRANTGFAGSVANVAGYVAPGGVLADAIKGVRLLPQAVRAVPAVARVVPAAERAVMGFVNPARANFYARLGLGDVPTVSGAIGHGVSNIAANVGDYVGAHKLLTAGVLGGGAAAALANYGDSGPANASAPAAKTAAAADKTAAPAGGASATDNSSAQTASPATSLDSLIAGLARSQGGKVSLNQLGAIGDFVAKTSTDLKHPPSYKDAAATELQRMSDASYNTLIAQSQAAKAKGDIPNATALQEQARLERRQDLRAILGQDPLNTMLAQGAGAQTP